LKKQTLIIAFSIVTFTLAIVAVSYILGTKSSQDSQQVNGTADHHQSQSASNEKFNALMGKAPPDFTLYSYEGKQVSLSQQKGKKVVLFFTEGVMCYPACWNQIAAFGKDETFKGDDVVVLTIVVDTKGQWDQAVKKMPELVSSPVLFDSSKSVSGDYGVLSLPSSMHKGQFPGHTYLILDRDGIVKFILDDPQMAVRNDELKAELGKIN